jgi:hypothetical protein
MQGPKFSPNALIVTWEIEMLTLLNVFLYESVVRNSKIT